jgi:hypothetical protein
MGQSTSWEAVSRLPFIKPERSLPCSQQPATGPYPEPDESSPDIQPFLSMGIKGCLKTAKPLYNSIQRDGRITFMLNTTFRVLAVLPPSSDWLSEVVTWDWKILREYELHDLYSSPDIINIIQSKRMLWVGRVLRMGEMRNTYTILVGKPEEKSTWESRA